ncbi:hypothetical protein [Photobacterium leiognathi]|uniref:hypothetical protein n=1 Tax=Photobacterium leiognathi TaxID=553611 RepID=UPI002980F826|nr:hypothetical protein [Photobacterium leiognathi]
MNKKMDVSDHIDSIRNMTNDSTLYTQSKFADCVFNIIEISKKNGDKLPYRAFLKLLECEGITNKLEYQQFRYMYNLGYLNNFCMGKLYCNSLRKASAVKAKLTGLSDNARDNIKYQVTNSNFVMLNTLEEWVEKVSKSNADPLSLSVDTLRQSCNSYDAGLGEMIVSTTELPSGFFVNLTTEIAKNLWEKNLKNYDGTTNHIRTYILRVFSIYNSLIFLSNIMNTSSVFEVQGQISKTEMYKNCHKNINRTEIISLMCSHFISVFSQGQMENIRTSMLDFSNQLAGNQGRNITEMFITSLDGFRRVPTLQVAARPFF